MPAPQSIVRLLETFAAHKHHYLSGSYNETQLRREFLDPFFKALGWDIDNEAGYANDYKDVIHEDAIKVSGSTKAPDYCFRIGGTRKFFLEAKKPSVKIKTDAHPAFQLRRYGWSAKLPLSILSDFEEFAIYDTRIKPTPKDGASVARIFYCTFEEYLEKWDEIESIFSRDAILKGSFDTYAGNTRRKRGTTEVDDAFLEEIESWRELLAKNFALRNPNLNIRDLNFAVQRTIDRIIFLRICEDRGTEDYGRLKTAISGSGSYEKLCDLFLAADDRYNSGIFHFSSGKNQLDDADSITLNLTLDDKPVKEILKHLYYPDSPYEFSVLPADILGQVYERFLGKTIGLTSSHRAIIEDKPEVRKAGGVYYTPTYIVELMIKATLGALLNGPDLKNPEPVSISRAATIKVLDPSCGSGSFLIVAYQYLLDWHLSRYIEKSAQYSNGKTPKIYQSRNGTFRLTTDERKRILLNNIYGVDIDRQAVEVTKLSLLLKVLESETEQIMQRDWLKERQRILPNLGENIKCGNSLIGTDIFDDLAEEELNDDVLYQINAFDWNDEFPEVMQTGGFDCVIGNPPYIFTREQLISIERNYFTSRYEYGWEKQNTYLVFMERLLSLVSKKGFGAFIVPNSWLTIESAKLLRNVYIERIVTLIDMNYAAFRGVGMEPCIFIIEGKRRKVSVDCLRVGAPSELVNRLPMIVDRADWLTSGRITFGRGSDSQALLTKISQPLRTLEDEFEVKTGLQAYEAGKGTPQQTKEDVKNHVFDFDNKHDKFTHRYLEGKDIGRYSLDWSGKWMRYGPWLSQPRSFSMFSRPRILVREITSKPPYCINATLVEDVFLNNKSILNIYDVHNDITRLKFLCAILNSKLMSELYQAFAVKAARKIFPKIVVRNLREFKIPDVLNGRKPLSKECTMIVDASDRIFDAMKRTAIERNPDVRKHLGQRIAAENRKIDLLVYKLYGLSESDRQLLEIDTPINITPVEESILVSEA